MKLARDVITEATLYSGITHPQSWFRLPLFIHLQSWLRPRSTSFANPHCVEDVEIFCVFHHRPWPQLPDFRRIDEALAELWRPGVRFTIAIVNDDHGIDLRYDMVNGSSSSSGRLSEGQL